MNIVISQPMAGKTTAQIHEERRAVVQALESKGHTVAETVFTDEPLVNNPALYHLGMAFQFIASSDAVLFMEGWESARGCRMEMEACKAYGVPIILQGV